MQGKKTHEQLVRNLERKDDLPADAEDRPAGATHEPNDPQARQSEMQVSRGGMNQESRDHNKHNNSGQSGHEPQAHSPAEEKH